MGRGLDVREPSFDIAIEQEEGREDEQGPREVHKRERYGRATTESGKKKKIV